MEPLMLKCSTCGTTWAARQTNLSFENCPHRAVHAVIEAERVAREAAERRASEYESETQRITALLHDIETTPAAEWARDLAAMRENVAGTAALLRESESKVEALRAGRDESIRVTVREAAQLVAESGPLTLQRKDLERRILALAGAPRTTPPESAPEANEFGTHPDNPCRIMHPHTRTSFCDGSAWPATPPEATAPERDHGWCSNPNCKGGCGCTQTGVCACPPPAAAKDEETNHG